MGVVSERARRAYFVQVRAVKELKDKGECDMVPFIMWPVVSSRN
jgi:hypothetical protein